MIFELELLGNSWQFTVGAGGTETICISNCIYRVLDCLFARYIVKVSKRLLHPQTLFLLNKGDSPKD